MKLLILSAAGSCTAVEEVHKGLSGSISLDENVFAKYEHHSWRIDSDCESLHFKSKRFGNNFGEIFYIYEEGSDIVLRSKSDEYFDLTTNTGDVKVNFDFYGSKHDDGELFEIDWECAKSNESDVEEVDESDESNVQEGSSGRISLVNGYEINKKYNWQINSDCESLHFKSTLMDTHSYYDRLYIDEEGIEEGSEYIYMYSDEVLDHKTNTGNVQVRFVTDDHVWNDYDGFEVDWQCAEVINSCDADPCDVHENCKDDQGEYTCSCMDGYYLNVDFTCEADVVINSCDAEPCNVHENCKDVLGEYTCSCMDGYNLNVDFTCEALGEPICSHNGKQMKIWNDYNVWGDREGRRSEGGTEGGTEEKCKNLCLKNTECVAFLFKRRTKICELITGTEGIKYFYSDADSVSGIKCGHNPRWDILVLFMNLVVDEIYPESIVDEVDEVEKGDESNVRSDEELALTKAVCPSSDCWTLNEANSTCEIIMSSDCFQLDCSFDRMTIKFDYGLFGGSSEAPQLNDFSPAISQFDVAENLPFMLDCEFDQCAISPEVVLAPRKLNLKTTITKSKNENDMVKLGDDVLIRNANGVSMVFLCVYETEIKLTDAKFDVKKAEVAGSVSERGDLDLGFTLEVMGSEYIGGTRSALITWKQGGKLSNINFLATDCTIEHGGKKISIIKETCISRGLYGQSGSQTDHKKIIEFNWMSFMLLEKETVTQQILVCKILICSAGADDCTPISDDACPGNDDGYDFQQFKIY